jgi:hypothetical protein
VAGILKRLYGYERKGWADALKREVYRAFGLDMLTPLWAVGVVPDTSFDAWKAFIDAHKYDAPGTEYGWIRPILQFWGTEYRRNLCGQDYWTRQLELYPGVVVTDCRFPDEAKAIRDAGGIIWRIERPGYGGDTHASEQHIAQMRVAAVVGNNSSLEELEATVRRTFTRCLVARGLEVPVG